jgi:hypothetical protein
MLYLEDKTHITGMNKLSWEEQRKLVLSQVKTDECKVYFEVIKKKQTDRKNFHILTRKGTSLLRQEFLSYWEGKQYVLWSVSKKNSERQYGDFGTIIDKFNKMEE